MENCEADTRRTDQEIDKMASKFNVRIEGGSGPVIMGDAANISINSTRGSRGNGLQSSLNIHPGVTRHQPNAVHSQETGVFKSIDNSPYIIKQGYALIIHNRYFPNKAQPMRHGSEKDVEAIKHFCELAGITINDTGRKTEDLTANEIEELCEEISKRDFSRYDGFVCFILSHGNESGIYGRDDLTVSVQEIVSKFKDNPGLVKKPKLFFIQACRGTNKDSGVDSDSVPVGKVTPLRLPFESDVLIAYSSVEGYESYRSTEVGSWYIITLMEILNANAHNMHLMDILTLVNQRIAGYETPLGNKQMPCQMSTLTKFVYFKVPPPLM